MRNEVAKQKTHLLAVRGTRQSLAAIETATVLQQASIRAKSAVGEFAIHEVTYLKRVQAEVEQRTPDAADAVALIVNTTIAAIARDVAQFGTELR